ncbi:MAG: SDR family NAD(P)-dependent oxidoreductase [Alphaproteobacteria bacterium]
MNSRFLGKVVLVTGASGGIGSVAARRFAAEGATVVATGRQVDDRLRALGSEIEAAGGRVRLAAMDVSDEAQVRAAVESAASDLGGLDVAFNVAGVFLPPKPIVETPVEDWDKLQAGNLRSAFVCTKVELAIMARAGRGAIVNTASSLGVEATRPGLAAYAAAKAGVHVLTETAALEAAPLGVRVNCVSPGTTDTSMSMRPGETSADRDARATKLIPMRRLARPDEIVDVVLWLASDDASYVTGRDILVDGGQVLQH